MAVAELLDQITKLSQAEREELLIGATERLSVVEALSLVKTMETKWDVKASGGGGFVQPQQPPTTVQDEPAAAKTPVTKEIRVITGLSLKEAKELADKAPSTVKEKMPREEAEKAKTSLEALGAVVELK